MSSPPLSEQYNKEVVPAPAPLKADVPFPRRPIQPMRPAQDIDMQSLREIGTVLGITIMLLLGSIVGSALLGGGG